MTRAKLFSVLLIVAICLPFLSISNVSSQMSITTTTTTIKVPQAGQCSVLAIPFSAPVKSVLTGEFTADVMLDFYILSQNDYSVFSQSGNCQPVRAKPLFKLTDVGGARNQYNSIPIPTDGTYLFVFIYRTGLSYIASGYATVRLSFPSFITFITTQTSSSAIVTTPATSTLTTAKNS